MTKGFGESNINKKNKKDKIHEQNAKNKKK